VKNFVFNKPKKFVYLFIFYNFLFLGKIYAIDMVFDLVKPNGEVIIMQTPDGQRFGLWGKNVSYPAPTLFIFAGTVEQSLGESYFRQCGNQLAEEGFLCVSLDLPGHGLEKRAEEPEGLSAWRYRTDRDEDFVTPFTDQARNVLDYLIQAGYTDSERIGACGTSRGGFMALQLTAVEKLVKVTAVFCPVIELMALYEFKDVTNRDFVISLTMKAKAGQLIDRSLWLIIGDRDERVGTDNTIEFAREVTNLSLEQSKKADVTFIVQTEPGGHTTPADAPEKAAKWILKKIKPDEL